MSQEATATAGVQEGLLVVGLGASAGGIQALRSFFERVPADSGVAYVVVLHLAPDHDSRLAEVLQGAAEIPVTRVTESVRLEPDQVYVASPDRHLTLTDGVLAVEQNTQMEDRRAPVDIFFRTLAESHGPRAVGVVLSGTGADGSLGLKRLKENGGAVLVQNPREAEFSEMPRNAIATGLVDEVLSVSEIPGRIIRYRDRLGTLEIRDPGQEHDENARALSDIFTQLRQRTGHDFSNYKRPTLLRRVARRVGVRNLPDLASYAAYLHDEPQEAQFLLKDLLISVTNFFRDREAFDALEHDVLPKLFEGKGPDDEVRVWVVGCATGEEAYSIAMLLAERVLGVLDAPKVQVFATDIDEAAVATARGGLYSLNVAADVSPDRLQRFFQREGAGYRVRREVRETILFARHNVLKDSPFSRLDLATCRNLLIYLNQPAQERVLETLHFALRPGGYLMLGSSESVDSAPDLYAVVDREHDLYQSRPVAARQYPLPYGAPALQLKPPATPAFVDSPRTNSRLTYGDLHGRLLEAYAPPSVVVNSEFEVVHLSERAGQYLLMGGGEPSDNLLHLVRPELHIELRTALNQALERQSAVTSHPVRLNGGGAVTMHVRPVIAGDATTSGFILVVFDDADGAAVPAAATVSDEPVVKQLAAEIERLKSELRSTTTQYEMQTEALRASNEELQALNEELRSAAEELETSKEELQSINEELTTVNQELKVQVEETSLANNNLRNLINSTDIGVIFLDKKFRVQLFTPAAREVFNLIPSDVGRPLADITHRIEFQDLIHDAKSVLENLQGVERELTATGGRHYLMRILPYRTVEDRINGVVVTFVDIDQRKRSELALRDSREKYRLLFDSIDEGFCLLQVVFDADGGPTDYRFLETNKAFEQLTGLRDAVGRSMLELVPDIERKWIDTYGEVARTGESVRFEDDSVALGRHFDVYASAVGEGGLVALVFRDVSEHKRHEANQALLVETGDTLNRLTDPDEIVQWIGARLGEYLGINTLLFVDIDESTEKGVVNHSWAANGSTHYRREYRITELLHDGFAAAQREGELVIIADTDTSPLVKGRTDPPLNMGSALSMPYHVDGIWKASVVMSTAGPSEWRAEDIELARGIADRLFPRIARARAEEALVRLNETLEEQVQQRTEAWLNSRTRFQRAFEAGPTASAILTLDDRFLEVNTAFTEMTGYTEAEVKGRKASELGMWSSREDKDRLDAALAAGGGCRHVEASLRTKDGARLDILLSAERVKSDDEDTWLKMFLDVTERHRTQESLMRSIEAVMTDTDWFGREVIGRLAQIRSGRRDASSLDVLSAREKQVLEHVANGSSDQQIAAELGLKRKTVSNHIANIYTKLGVHSRVEAVLWARERGVGG